MPYAIRQRKGNLINHSNNWFAFDTGKFTAPSPEFALIRTSRSVADDEAMMIAQAWPGERIEVVKLTDDSEIVKVVTSIVWRN